MEEHKIERAVLAGLAADCFKKEEQATEPTLGLDVLARAELWDLIRSLKGEMTVILTTHYMEEAEALSDRIGVMGKGRLLTVGTAAELKEAAGAATLEEAFIRLAKEAAK